MITILNIINYGKNYQLARHTGNGHYHADVPVVFRYKGTNSKHSRTYLGSGSRMYRV